MKTAPSNDAKQTHRMVGRLSERMQATLVAVYVRRMSPADAGQVLGCEPGTVGARVEAAHRALMGMLVEFCKIV